MINCVFENGNKASLRHITIDGLIVKDNKILLIRRAEHLTNPNKLALPGGFLDRDETASEAVRREIMEETGYEVNKVTLFRINDNPNRKGEDRQNVDFVFIVEAGEKTGEPDNEVEKMEWHDLNNLPEESEFAFDHYENVKLYLDHLKNPKNLPIF